MTKYHDIAIALAGVCQSASLVPQLANTGNCDRELYYLGMRSVFNTSPSSTLNVFGERKDIQSGLKLLVSVLGSEQKENADVLRYTFGTLGITHKLRNQPETLNDIGMRIQRVASMHPEMSLEEVATHSDELSYSLAGIYSDIISPVAAKIKVMGKIEYLQNTLVQAKVRTALFACVRAAILWYQVGGTRWQFIFSRKKIVQAAQELLTEY
ncbi:high frequency lysogenization protein HflD [Zophobihabitans entericus]|uniref:High frequency lysogenization protein HflD homolog n=1 Tax=Zophobihabitans entericus TaxID=1635327 RepID=A0A6G9IAK1_9GAMM|nr:high frequency lysogenization protein HflD [Zophobihabitans entericus]QIQ21256.1 high frequency lysogenization protein HflD [Zophobihabitans entericus]